MSKICQNCRFLGKSQFCDECSDFSHWKLSHDAKVFSDRGNLLIISCSSDLPILTIELYIKWYTLYKVFPDGTFEKVTFPDCDEHQPSSVDHVPNPKAVKKFADDNNLILDELAYEIMVGRWETEVKNNY